VQVNDDFRNKFMREQEKLNTFLDEMIQLMENHRLTKTSYD